MKTMKRFLRGYEVRELLEFSEYNTLKYNVNLDIALLLVTVIRTENILSIDFSMHEDTIVSEFIHLDMSLEDKAVDHGYNELLERCKNKLLKVLIQEKNNAIYLISMINNMQRKEVLFGDIQ